MPPRSRCKRCPGQWAGEVPCAAARGATAPRESRRASARETPRVQQARALDQQRLTALDRQRVTCGDEAGVHRALTRRYGRAPAGARGIGSGPQTYGLTVTRLGALGAHGLHAVMTAEGATAADVLRPDVRQGLGPAPRPGEIVVMDHLRAHNAVGGPQAVARRGARLRYLPPSSPALSPLEPCWSEVQTALRTAKARTREALDRAITGALATSTEADAHGWVRHGGYALRERENRFRV